MLENIQAGDTPCTSCSSLASDGLITGTDVITRLAVKDVEKKQKRLKDAQEKVSELTQLTNHQPRACTKANGCAFLRVFHREGLTLISVCRRS